MTIIGLDLSTSICGISIVSENGILLLDALDFNKTAKKRKIEPTLLNKAGILKEYVTLLYEKYKFDKIVIEDFLKGFAYGRTSQQTIILLAMFNGIAQYMLSVTFADIPLEKINVNAARKLVVGKIPRKKEIGITAKEFVFAHMLAFVPELASYKNNRDISDALVLALSNESVSHVLKPF